ncbi:MULTISPECIES: fimbrial protein [Burkholderiales]|uniref:fimbrial protein n=1 Tax=Paraburkholderia fungorum TaxID=134537 RepID=UPI0004705B5D
MRRSHLTVVFRSIFQACVIFLFGVTSVHATCTWVGGAGPQIHTFAIPAITIAPNSAVGTVIYSPPTQSAIPSTGNYMSCDANDSWSYGVNGGPLAASSPATYSTNVPGIGIRFYRLQSGIKSYFGPTNSGNYGGYWSYSGAAWGIEVVVTGPVGSGIIDGTLVGTFSQSGITVATLKVTAGTVVASSCSINTVQSLEMPKVGPKDLPTVGSTAGNTPFTITLNNCPSGMNQITYQLDAPSGVIDAANGTFLAGSGSTSQGVGFVLKDSSSVAVRLGTPHVLSTYRPATGGSYPIPLVVQYYRTGAIGAGKINGTLTYTMSYQ